MKRVICLVLAAVLMLSVSGCTLPKIYEFSKTELILTTRDISYMVGTSGTAEDAADLLRKHYPEGSAPFLEAETQPDGSLRLLVNEKQRQYWLRYFERGFRYIDKKYRSEDPKTSAEISPDRMEISCRCLPGRIPWPAVQGLYMWARLHAVFSGKEGNAVSVHYRNADTGKELYLVHDSQGNLAPVPESWSNSYMLTPEEAEALPRDRHAEEFLFRDPLEGQISWHDVYLMNSYLNMAGDQYSYLYLDEDKVLHAGFTEEQAEQTRQHLKAYIESAAEELAEQGGELTVSEDCRMLHISYPRSMEEQITHFTRTAMACLLLQMMEGEEEPCVRVKFYDADTGSFLAFGDTGTRIPYEYLTGKLHFG